MATLHCKEDERAPIPLGVPADMSGNGGTLDELQRHVSYRSQREDGLARRVTELTDEKERDVEPDGSPDEDEVREDDRSCGPRRATTADLPVLIEQPKNNMWLVTPALLLITFISAMDQTVRWVTRRFEAHVRSSRRRFRPSRGSSTRPTQSTHGSAL